jgi:pyruvate dehydrogenase E1 component
MYGDAAEDVFYYLTLYNENYSMPAMPEGAEEGIVRGLYRYRPAPKKRKHRTQLLASGTAMLAALEAQELLADEFDVATDVWSATSYKLLREEALEAERWSRLHPKESTRVPYVTQCLGDAGGPIVAVTDFMKVIPDQISRFVPAPFVPLGTDGYGFSDTRPALRRHFEVDAAHVVVATLDALARSGAVKTSTVTDAIARFDLDPDRPDPRTA